VSDIVTAFRREPKLCLKSLALIPKALAMAEGARREKVHHVHAEFAGHPATVAWLMHRFGGPAYSVSCRAHDIFRTQSLLDRKLSEAKAVRTVSRFGRAFLRDRVPGLADKPIHVIHSSVDVIRLAPVETVPPSPFRVLFVGALEAKKGVQHLLAGLALANEALGEWECELAGDGPLRTALEQQARALGLADRVRFHGALDFDAVSAAYRRASVCVAPSVIGPGGRQEGIPNVMIEALAYAKPAISTPISGIPELIDDGVSGLLVPPADPAALAAALLRVRGARRWKRISTSPATPHAKWCCSPARWRRRRASERSARHARLRAPRRDHRKPQQVSRHRAGMACPCRGGWRAEHLHGARTGAGGTRLSRHRRGVRHSRVGRECAT
jgi:glycosyltransferase involved in cell wall biosynthesis